MRKMECIVVEPVYLTVYYEETILWNRQAPSDENRQMTRMFIHGI